MRRYNFVTGLTTIAPEVILKLVVYPYAILVTATDRDFF
jgi:hypothetical protein